jgi:hypothetical protein
MYGFSNVGYGGGIQMPMPQQVQPPQQVGRWLMVHNYKDVEVAPIPIDGTPSLFMLADKPVFYVVTMQGGQKFISAFEFQEQTNTPQQQQESEQKQAVADEQPQQVNALEERLAQIEQGLVSLRKAVVGSESDISANEPASTTTNGKAQNGRRK